MQFITSFQVGDKEEGKPIVEKDAPEGFPKCYNFKGKHGALLLLAKDILKQHYIL